MDETAQKGTFQETQDSESTKLSNCLLQVAVEAWRFGRVFDRVVSKLELEERARYQSQFRWFLKKLEQSLGDVGIRLVNLEGQPYDPGVAATAINLDDFQPEEPLEIDQMLEPVVMGRQGLLKSGAVMLRRAAP